TVRTSWTTCSQASAPGAGEFIQAGETPGDDSRTFPPVPLFPQVDPVPIDIDDVPILIFDHTATRIEGAAPPTGIGHHPRRCIGVRSRTPPRPAYPKTTIRYTFAEFAD